MHGFQKSYYNDITSDIDGELHTKPGTSANDETTCSITSVDGLLLTALVVMITVTNSCSIGGLCQVMLYIEQGFGGNAPYCETMEDMEMRLKHVLIDISRVELYSLVQILVIKSKQPMMFL